MQFTHETTTWSMSKAELKALLLFASKDPTRSNLNVVAFLPSDGSVQATDSYVALTVSPDSWKPGSGKSVPLPFAPLRSIATAAAASDAIEFAFSPGGDRGWTVVASWGNGMRLEIEPADVTHPPLRQVWPAAIDKSGSRMVINSAFLARMNAIAQATKVHTNPVQIYPGADETAPVLFVHQADGCVWSAIVMPLRDNFTVDVDEAVAGAA